MAMKLIVGAGTIALMLSACTGGDGTNPINGGRTTDDTTDTNTDDSTGLDTGGGSTSDPQDPDANNINSKYGGEVNSVTVNTTTGQMVVNNLPFDGQSYTRNNSVSILTGFDLYENQQIGETGTSKYFVVYGESASGALKVAAVATGDYVDEGYGGYAITRDSSTVALPSTGEAVYTGNYAGVRTIYESSRGEDDVQLTSGDAVLRVDFGDFDVVGAVDGYVQNRTYYDTDGTLLGVLPTIILGTSEINGDSSFTGGSATTFDSDSSVIASGSYEGLFAGTDGSEIGGVIILDGPFDETAPDLSAYERGVFLVAD